MKLLEKGTAVAAIASALSTMACCLPLGLLGSMGLVGMSIWAQHFRRLLLGAAIMFLFVGLLQLYAYKRKCVRRSTSSVILFWTAVVFVILVMFFPQVIASLIAG